MPTSPKSPEITELLARWRDGNREAEAALLQAVYPLCAISPEHDSAARRATSPCARPSWRTRPTRGWWGWTSTGKAARTFFAIASRAIRNVVVDYQRAQNADKRGRDVPFLPLEIAAEVAGECSIDLRTDWLAVHEALNELEAIDAQSARIVEKKFFSGLTTDEIAEANSISRATVVREWRFARAWLAQRLDAEGSANTAS